LFEITQDALGFVRHDVQSDRGVEKLLNLVHRGAEVLHTKSEARVDLIPFLQTSALDFSKNNQRNVREAVVLATTGNKFMNAYIMPVRSQ